jgi:hypothetical protein
VSCLHWTVNTEGTRCGWLWNCGAGGLNLNLVLFFCD